MTRTQSQDKSADRQMKRMVFLLAACLSLSNIGTVMVIMVTGLVGKMLAPVDGFWTMALTLQFAGTMVTTIPANLLMRRIGRKNGFILGQAVGACGALVSVYAIYQGSFDIFCVGGFILGIHNAFWFYYRFAASEVASDSFKSKAISYVMAGGVVAAILGGEVAKFSKDLLTPYSYAGCYMAIIVLCLFTIAVLQFVQIPGLSEEEQKESGRPLREIIIQPLFLCAVVAAMIGYGAMSLVMTATPLAMEACGFVFNDSTFVIQWHAVSMFAPSFFTGSLIKRFGAIRIISTGILAMFLAIGINLSGIEMLNFLSGLILLGLGWNFMFIGGTTLLTECYTKFERNKVQALNDFLVFCTVAATSLTAGILQKEIGWEAVNISVLVPLFIAVCAVIWAATAQKKQAAKFV